MTVQTSQHAATTSDELQRVFEGATRGLPTRGLTARCGPSEPLDRLLAAVLSVADELAAAQNDDYGNRLALSNLGDSAAQIGLIGHLAEHRRLPGRAGLGGPVLRAAVQSPPVHRLTGRRPTGAGSRKQEPHPGDARAGRENPVVVAPDADIVESARSTAAARMGNGGQVCLCPDYAFVPADRLDEFVVEARQFLIDSLPDFLNNPNVTTPIPSSTPEQISAMKAAVTTALAAVEQRLADGGFEPFD